MSSNSRNSTQRELVCLSSSDSENEEEEEEEEIQPGPADSSESENPSSSSDSSSSDSDSDSDAAPKKNIIAPRRRGVLLQHHLNVLPETRRLIICSGQKIDENFFSFTQKEDQQIKENWERLAKQLNYKGHIFEFLGYDKDGLKCTNNTKLSVKVRNVLTWPTLCFGLNNRYAKLIKERISFICHPYYREIKDQDLEEIDIRYDNNETMLEISEALKIPPRYLERIKSKERKTVAVAGSIEGAHKLQILKFLYESIVENPKRNTFCTNNFNWKIFRKKCRENSITPPNFLTTARYYGNLFFQADRRIFNFLEPQPTLHKKVLYFHEALARYLAKNGKGRKMEAPQLKYSILFTVVFEDYNKDGTWDPPTEMEKYSSQVDLKKVRKRVECVNERTKRAREVRRISVLTPKRFKLREVNESMNSNDVLEISSIHNESSSNALGLLDRTNDVMTDLDLSITNTSSQILGNETILARGGGALDPTDEASLNETSTSQIPQTEKNPIELDLSQDIWSQIVNWA